eukprot:snap_masked-scaffold_23-processed-gene-5.39-mRNA-1 protein AED:1.00 eAED:1.00 QI:0/0/0/0/1/1/2/0/90
MNAAISWKAVIAKRKKQYCIQRLYICEGRINCNEIIHVKAFSQEVKPGAMMLNSKTGTEKKWGGELLAMVLVGLIIRKRELKLGRSFSIR